MREYIFALGLMSIEMAIFYFFTLVFNLSIEMYIKLSLIWLIIMFVFKHYKIQSTLVWNEILNNIKSFVCFVLIGFVIYPKKEYYLRILVLGFLMFICAVYVNRMIRIIFRHYLARKTVIIGAGNEAYRIGKIANNNRFALTEVIGYFYFDESELADFQLRYGDTSNLFNYNELDIILKKNCQAKFSGNSANFPKWALPSPDSTIYCNLCALSLYKEYKSARGKTRVPRGTEG